MRVDVSIFGMFAFLKSSYYILRHKKATWGSIKMSDENENIHLFIIKEAYSRLKEKQGFSTNARALDIIFDTDYLSKAS